MLSEKNKKKAAFFLVLSILSAIALYNIWAYQGTIFAYFIKNAKTDYPHKPLSAIINEKGLKTPIPDLKLEVIKSKRELAVFSGQTLLKKYDIAMGKHHLENKEKVGDYKTPEGVFMITEKKDVTPSKKLGTKMLQLNYPNNEHAVKGLQKHIITGKDFLAIESALKRGVTPPQDTGLGGDIAIHGGGGPFRGRSWTNGSIGLYSKDIEDMFDFIHEEAQVIIRK